MRSILSSAAGLLVVSVLLAACAQSTTQGPGANSAVSPTTAQAGAGDTQATQTPGASVEKSDGGW